MLSHASYVASFLKLAMFARDKPHYSLAIGKLMLSRLAQNWHVPAEGRGAAIRQVSIRISDRCNLRCHTCGQWGDNGYLLDRPLAELIRNEVTTERYLELVDDLAAHGHRPGIYLWGGEPMLSGSTLPLIEKAAQHRMPTSIATNGTGLAKHAERLVGAPLYLAQVSIDGGDAATHNASRPGVNASTDNFAVVTDALDRLRAERDKRGAHLPMLAGLCTINQRNADRLMDVYDAFAGKVDVLVFYLSWWIDEASAQRHTAEFARRFGFEPSLHIGWIGGWRPTDYAKLSQQLTALNQKSLSPSGPAVVILPHLTKAEDLERYYTDHDATFGYDKCTSVYRAVELNANGDMSPCRDYHDYVVGNVKTHSITELWDSEAYRTFRCSMGKDGLMPVCTRCCGLMGN